MRLSKNQEAHTLQGWEYVTKYPSSFVVAEEIGNNLLFIAKMHGMPAKLAMQAGNSFMHAADIVAEDANRRQAYGKEEFFTVKRNLQKARESFELFLANAKTENQVEIGNDYVRNLSFRLGIFDEKWTRDLSTALKGYSAYKTPPARLNWKTVKRA